MSISLLMVRPTLFSFFLAILHLSLSLSDQKKFILVNECKYRVWPASFPINGNRSLATSYSWGLRTGDMIPVLAPTNWSGHIWGRTFCTNDLAKGGNFSCITGDCGTGSVSCDGKRGAPPPATLAEFRLGKNSLDFYKINVMEGFNIPIVVAPIDDFGENLLSCSSAGCTTNIKYMCPREFKVMVNGSVVACQGACSTENLQNSTPKTCNQSDYSLKFKTACPQADGNPYDNWMNAFTCSTNSYKIIFCPSLGSSDQNVSVGDSLIAGNGTSRWLSPSREFAFGFYQLHNDLFLLAIWYDKILNDSIIWYANGDNPAPKGSKLVLSDTHGLMLTSPHGLELWRSSNFTSSRVSKGLMKDDGNFQLLDQNFVILWNSFDHPTDTLVPGQELNSNRYLYSRQGESNFSRGMFELCLRKNGHGLLLNLIKFPTNTYYNTQNDGYYESCVVDQNNEPLKFGDRLIFNNSYFFLSIIKFSGETINITEPKHYVSNNAYYYKATFTYDGVFSLSYHPKDPNNIQSWIMEKTIPENICLNSTFNKGLGICGLNSICTPISQRPVCTCAEGYSLMDSNNKYGGCIHNFPVICQGTNHGSQKDTHVMSITFGIFIAIVITLAGAIFVWYNSKKIKSSATEKSVVVRNLRIFSFREITEVTNNFREELGRGSCSIVYKGKVDVDTCVAVKKLDKLFQDSDKEFQTEMNVIIKTHHRNLVRLHGYCSEDQHRILVYELMSNGTLARFLFTPLKPNWNQRVQIAIGIARGLVYLHEECSTQIIHCDIKPQNILLDDDYNARISDFGLAKLLLINQSHTKTGIRGTKGYVAPDWFRSAPITAKVDAYSFGVVLLEIICCRKNVENDDVSEDKRILTDWAYDCYKAKKLDILLENEHEAVNDMSRIEKFVMISIWCTQEDPSLRPPMKKVLLMLEGIVEVEIPPSPYLHGSFN